MPWTLDDAQRQYQGRKERENWRKEAGTIAKSHCAKLAVELCCDFLKSRKRRLGGKVMHPQLTSFQRFVLFFASPAPNWLRGRFSTLVCTMMCDAHLHGRPSSRILSSSKSRYPFISMRFEFRDSHYLSYTDKYNKNEYLFAHDNNYMSRIFWKRLSDWLCLSI